jgi:hypothetical protein
LRRSFLIPHSSFLFIIFFLGCTASYAQQQDSLTVLPELVEDMPEEAVGEVPDEIYTQPYTPPPAQPVLMRKVEKEQWAKAATGLDYSKDQPKPPKEEKPFKVTDPAEPFNWGAMASWVGQILQVLAIIAAIFGIAYGIYRTMNAPRNRQIARDGVEITVDNVEQYIHESDLEHFLREAIAAGNFPLAIRLYYLQVIKKLSESEAIRWSREKTNRDYLRETRAHRAAAEFRATTRIYERVWYGNQQLDEPAYQKLEPEFKNLLAVI